MDVLVKKIDFNELPMKTIKYNSIILHQLLQNIKKIKINWNQSFIKHHKSSLDPVLQTCLLYENPVIKELIDDKIVQIYSLEYENIIFYYIDTGNFKKDYNLIITLFKISVLLTKFVQSKNNVVCIWIPIDLKRDFIIEPTQTLDKNIEESENKFNAFTASGVSWQFNNKHYSVVSRYEEIEKLLLHELIHNLNIDGSKNSMDEVLKKYNKTKGKCNYHYAYSMFETFAELISTYLYIIFMAYFNPKIQIKNWIIIELIYGYNIVANLIKLQNVDYDTFIKNPCFKGNICIYEYYYLKALAYTIDISKYDIFKDQKNIYEEILQLKNDKLLKHIYINMVPVKNFSYIYSIKHKNKNSN